MDVKSSNEKYVKISQETSLQEPVEQFSLWIHSEKKEEDKRG